MKIQNPSAKIKRNNQRLQQKYNITTERDRKTTSEKLKQKLLAKNNRLKRYKARKKQFEENRDFFNTPDKFYKQLRGTNIQIDKSPTKEQIEEFWKEILGTSSHYNTEAPWLAEYESEIEIEQYNFEPISKRETSEAIMNFANWKSPGIDHLQNFWWGKFEKIHEKLTNAYNLMTDNPDTIPQWFTSGRTTLLAKKAETDVPSNYRPITCLPIAYKIMTSIITKRMKNHLQEFDLIPEEQKGGISGKQGTIDQLLIDDMILSNARKNKRNLSTGWIDYRKAFDSIPHDWLIKSLEIHKFPQKIIDFFTNTMKMWRTTLNLTTEHETISTEPIEIKTGIFQGDCPSGLNFVLCLLPLSWLLKRSSMGYSIGPRNNRKIVSHLLFMDDLKIYANNDQKLHDLAEIVSMFSKDIQMSFGLDKCNIMKIKKGKLAKGNDIVLANNETIKALEIQDQYKYLGILQSNELKKKGTKKKFRDEYFVRVKKILNTSLNSKNTIAAINTFAVPSISYGFNVLDWSITELQEIDRETRNILKKCHLLHINSDVDRMYISRKNGGRGLLNITDLYKNQAIAYSHYLSNSTDPLTQLASTWQNERGAKSIHHKATKYMEELTMDQNQFTTLTKTQLKTTIKTRRSEKKSEKLKNKPMHGQYFKILDEPHIDKKASLSWMNSSSLKRATEATICAIQENAVTTKYTQTHIHKTSIDDKCRACKTEVETIHHIISGCSVLAPTKYIERHDNVCRYIHLLLAEKYDLLAEYPQWYQYDPEPLLENEVVKILWNFPVQTDRRTRFNKPDILVIDKTTRRITIIDVAIPVDTNISKKRNEKITKYADLAIEIKQLWNATKVTTVPIIVGAMGTIHEKFEKLIYDKMSLKVNINEMQKIVLLGTSNISRYFFSTDF